MTGRTDHGRGDRAVSEAWAWFLGSGAAAVVVYFLLGANDDLQALDYELLAGLSAAAVTVGVRLHGARRSSGWLLLAAGIAMWAFGDLLWNAHESLFDTPPFPSLADVAYLAAYPLLLLAVLRLARDRLPQRDGSAFLDALAVTLAVALPAWIVVLGPIRDDETLTHLGKAVATAYPVADLLLLAVLVRLVLTPGIRTAAYWLLLAGIGANLVADSLFAVPAISTDYVAGSPLDGLYLVGYLLMGAAALHPSMVGVAEPPVERVAAPSRGRVALVALAGLSAPALLAVESADGDIQHLPLIIGGWCLLLGVLLARLLMLMQELAIEARTDPLTRLPNRAHLLDRLDSALTSRDGVADDVALLYLDLDGFRAVNESVGHHGGDRLLVDVADRLRTIVRPGDMVARLSGDEFVVLCEGIADEAAVRAIADRLAAGLDDPFWLDGAPHFLSASIGISRATSADAHAAGLLRDADAAMYRAKAGPARAEVYDPSMRQELSLRGRFEHDLFDALDRGELQLHYQPVLDLRAGAVSGVEAVLRWQHPDWGMTKPESILPIAEETGLIVPIGRWVLSEACRQVRAWQHEDPATAPREVTVNVARRELLDPTFLAHLEDALASSGLDAGDLVLDVADEELADAPSIALDVLSRARGLGVHVCIDRFGAGRRSLGNLRRVPADRVKVDRSLAVGVAEEPGDRIVLTSVLQLGAQLGLRVTVAGVETRSQRTQLERMGCTHAQGNLWAPPLPPGSVLDAVLGRPAVRA